MEQVKKNLVSVICGVVALVAILFHLVYTSGKFTALENDAKKQVDRLKEAEATMATPHFLPKVTDDPPKPFPADKFPNDATARHNALAIQKLENEAAALWTRVMEINTGRSNGAPRPLLVPGSLPTPTDNLAAVFRSEYYRATRFVDRTRISEIAAPSGEKNLPVEVLQATVPPTAREIEEARQALWYDPAGKYMTRLQRILGADGKPSDQASNYPQVAAAFSRDTAGFTQEFLEKRANEGRIYVGTPPIEPGPATAGLSPEKAAAEVAAKFAENRATAVATALSVNQNINPINDRLPSVKDIWYAQVSFWVLQDVCNTIAAMNAPPPLRPGSPPEIRGVPASPVKHLFKFGLVQGPGMYKMGSGAAAAAPPPPPPVDSGDGSTPPPPAPAPVVAGKDFTVSPTGRVGNPLYDVVHYTLEVAVDAEYVNKLIEKLQEGRWTCVLRADAQVMDLGEAMDIGCFYGKRPVMYVRLECETLFLRDWTVSRPAPPSQPGPDGVVPPTLPAKPLLMPVVVQQELGIMPAPNAPGGPTPPTGDGSSGLTPVGPPPGGTGGV